MHTKEHAIGARRMAAMIQHPVGHSFVGAGHARDSVLGSLASGLRLVRNSVESVKDFSFAENCLCCFSIRLLLFISVYSIALNHVSWFSQEACFASD